MILLFADHCYLVDEEKPEAFVLYSAFVIAAAAAAVASAAGFEGTVNLGVVVFVLPA